MTVRSKSAAPRPWSIQPDQDSHGDSLAVVDANGEVVFRTPPIENGYGKRSQDKDVANAEYVVGVVNARKGIDQ